MKNIGTKNNLVYEIDRELTEFWSDTLDKLNEQTNKNIFKDKAI